MTGSDRALVGIVDYQAGNIRSVINAVEHVGAGARRVVTESDLSGLTHLVLPGVGAFGHCAERLWASGLVPFLQRWILVDRRPLLGICVGMQLLADWSEELGDHKGLGWGGGVVRRLRPDASSARVPHVGWNSVRFDEAWGGFRAGDEADFYFDHSYAYQEPTHAHRVASCTHGSEFCAVIRRGELVAAQFHPEKSQVNGLRFLAGFLGLRPPQ